VDCDCNSLLEEEVAREGDEGNLLDLRNFESLEGA